MEPHIVQKTAVKLKLFRSMSTYADNIVLALTPILSLNRCSSSNLTSVCIILTLLHIDRYTSNDRLIYDQGDHYFQENVFLSRLVGTDKF